MMIVATGGSETPGSVAAVHVSHASSPGVITCHSDRLTVLDVFTSHRVSDCAPSRLNDLCLRITGEKRCDPDICEWGLEHYRVRSKFQLCDFTLQRKALMMVSPQVPREAVVFELEAGAAGNGFNHKAGAVQNRLLCFAAIDFLVHGNERNGGVRNQGGLRSNKRSPCRSFRFTQQD